MNNVLDRNGTEGDVIMTSIEMIANVRASFAIEGMKMTKQDEERGKAIIEKKLKIDQAIEEIKRKYMSKENAV